MQVSVVVPSYNAREDLELLLQSLDRQEVEGGHTFEVVVVDDGSSDGTDEMVARLDHTLNLRYIHIPRTALSGRAAARNTGIEAANGAVVVLVDADQVVPSGFLARHIDYHIRHDALVVVGPRDDLEPATVDLIRGGTDIDLYALPRVDGGDFRERVLSLLSQNFNGLAACWHLMFSCNVSVRKEHLIAVGSFDTGFTGWGLEDSELGYRLRRRGLAFAYNPEAVLYHLHRQPWNSQMHKDWRRNLRYFAAKYDAPDVAAQWILDRTFGSDDPAVQSQPWLETFQRLEYATRALEGRYPGSAKYEIIEVDAANLEAMRGMLADCADEDSLVVIDHTGDREIAAVVQCSSSTRNVLLFTRPDATEQARIIATYGYPGRQSESDGGDPDREMVLSNIN